MHSQDASAHVAALVGATGEHDPSRRLLCLSVPQTARLLGVDPMTLYRAIEAGEFPAIRIRGRLTIPSLVIEQLITSAIATGGVVDVAAWRAAQATPAAPTAPPEGGDAA
jgi:excisionase family DNA binding protein